MDFVRLCDDRRQALFEVMESAEPYNLDIVFLALYELGQVDLLKDIVGDGFADGKAPVRRRVRLYNAGETLVLMHETPDGDWTTKVFEIVAAFARTFGYMFVDPSINHFRQLERLGGIAEGAFETDELPENIQMCKASLRLASAKPSMLFLVPTHRRDRFNVALGNCLWFEDAECSRLAEELLLKLQTPGLLEPATTGESIAEWNSVSSAAVLSLSRRLVDEHANVLRARELVSLVDRCLERRLENLKSFASELGQAQDIAEHLSTMSGVEIAILTLLCHPDVGVCAASSKLCRHLLTESTFYERIAGDQLAQRVTNAEFYAKVNQENFALGGRNAAQKKIRRLLRIADVSPGVRAAWVATYSRWSTMNTRLQEVNRALARGGESAPAFGDEMRIQWRNCAGFLASVNTRGRNQPTPGPLKSFISGLISHFADSNAVTREAVVDIVSNDLNPAILPLLIPELQVLAQSVFSSSGVMIMRDRNVTLIDQSITMLRGVLERFDKTRDFLTDTSLDILVSTISQFIKRIGELTAATRMRQRFARLCELVAQNCHALGIESEIKIKAEMRKILQSWVVQPDAPDEDPAGVRTRQELNLQCLRSLVFLSNSPFRLTSDFNSNRAVTELEEFIDFCVTLLVRYAQAENTSRTMVEAKQKSVIAVLQATLTGNFHLALPLYLNLAMSTKPELRQPFLTVILDVVVSGHDWMTQLSGDKLSLLRSLVATITESRNLTIVVAEGCNAHSTDSVGELILSFYESAGRFSFLMRAMIELEVKKVKSEGSLLRQNCMTTKLWSIYARREGQDYLRRILQPMLDFLVSQPGGSSLELDPARIETESREQLDSKLDANVRNLMRVSQIVVDNICASSRWLPNSLRTICRTLSELAATKFPEARFTAVGAFMILRFISPAIVSQGTDGSAPELSADARRGLVMVAKVVTNLANNVLFKEPFMTSINDFLEANVAQMTRFFYELAKDDSPSTSQSKSFASEQIRSRDNAALQMPRLLLNNMAAMRKIANEISAQDELETAVRLLDRVGIFPESSTGTPLRRQHSVGLTRVDEFMIKHEALDTIAIGRGRLFYFAGHSKDGRPILCFIPRLLGWHVSATRLALLALRVLSRFWDKPFDVFVDATAFATGQHLESALQQVVDLLPPYAVANCRMITCFNSNFAFRNFLTSTIAALLGEGHGHDRFRFLSSLHVLDQWYDYDDTSLPTTYTISKDSQLHHLDQATLVLGPSRIDVSVRFNETLLLLITKDRISADGFGDIPLFEVFRVDEIQEVSLRRQVDSSQQLLTVRIDHDRTNLSILVSHADAQVTSLKAFVERVQGATHKMRRPRAGRNDDPVALRGQLFHTVLHNLSSLDPITRELATQILCELRKQSLDPALPVLMSRGHVPIMSTEQIQAYSAECSDQPQDIVFAFVEHCIADMTPDSLARTHYTFMLPWLRRLAALPAPESGQSGTKATDADTTTDQIRAVIWELLSATTNFLDLSDVWTAIWLPWRDAMPWHETIFDVCFEYARLFMAHSREVSAVSMVLRTINSSVIIDKLMLTLKTCLQASADLEVEFDGRELLIVLQLCSETSYLSLEHFEKHVAALLAMTIALSGKLPGASTFSRQICFNLTQHAMRSLAKRPELDDLSHRKQLETVQSMFENSLLLLRPESDYTQKLKGFIVLGEAIKQCFDVLIQTTDFARTQRAYLMTILRMLLRRNSRAQGRAILAIGALATKEDAADILSRTARLLLETLRSDVSSAYNSGTLFGVLACFRDTIRVAPKDTYKTAKLALFALCMLQLPESFVASASLDLFNACLATDPNILAALLDVETYMPEELPMLDALGEHIGLRFADRMPFAMAGMLLQARVIAQNPAQLQQILIAIVTHQSARRRRPSTNDSSSDIVGTLGHIGSDTSPFLAMLLHMSTSRNEKETFLTLAGLDRATVVGDSRSIAELFFTYSDIPDNTHALLLLSLLTLMLEAEESQRDHPADFELLAEASQALPEIFAIVYPDLRPRMCEILAKSKDTEMLALIERIVVTVAAEAALEHPPQRLSRAQYCSELGFSYFEKWHPHHERQQTLAQRSFSVERSNSTPSLGSGQRGSYVTAHSPAIPNTNGAIIGLSPFAVPSATTPAASWKMRSAMPVIRPATAPEESKSSSLAEQRNRTGFSAVTASLQQFSLLTAARASNNTTRPNSVHASIASETPQIDPTSKGFTMDSATASPLSKVVANAQSSRSAPPAFNGLQSTPSQPSPQTKFLARASAPSPIPFTDANVKLLGILGDLCEVLVLNQWSEDTEVDTLPVA